VNRRAFAASSGGARTRRDRGMHGVWLSMRPSPPGGGCVRGFWLEQALGPLIDREIGPSQETNGDLR
jgi:hypothetical protein